MNSLRKWIVRHDVPAVAALVIALALSGSVPASARVTLSGWSGNIGFVSTKAVAGSITDQHSASPPGPGAWLGQPSSDAYDDETGASGSVAMLLGTAFDDSTFNVSTNGAGGASGGGSIQAGALMYVVFTVLRTQSYESSSGFIAGTFGSAHTLAFIFNHSSKDLQVMSLMPGGPGSGRLAPGIYALYLENTIGAETGDGTANLISTLVRFHDVPNPLIDQHPQDQTVAPGGSASFSVGTSGSTPAAALAPLAPQALTFQWRHRLQNLTDGGRITGATTSQLHIANVAMADTGVYDCVVTEGTIEEPSSMARLTVTGSTAVGDLPDASGLSLSAPAPSPFSTRTQVRFTLAAASEVSLDVLDVGGRRVRSLIHDQSRPAGAWTAEWNGRDDRGESSPPGVYFVRLAAGADHRVQRVVRIAP